MKRQQAILYASMAAVIIAFGCSKDRTISGTEITNGNCMGKIYNPDGTAAKGAIVKLIPMDYNPFIPTGDSLDSTYTNADGIFAFNASQSKFYNILAEKGSFSCLQDSIFVQAQDKTILDSDTLRESGIVKGIVRLKQGDDGRKAVILVLGTATYAIPSDTTGNFTVPPLPKGTYTVQIFTTLPGYAVFDTNFVIQEGAEAKLEVSLLSTNAPSIEKLSATYDSATMFVSLAWPRPDTSEIVSYALYRKSKFGRDTMVVLNKTALSYVDDIVGLDGDSVSYQIACIGKNYQEGYRTGSRAIIACGMVYCIKKIDLTAIGEGLAYIDEVVSVFSDQENELFLYGLGGIYKLDSNGVVQRDYIFDFSENYLTGDLQTDDAGNLYVCRTDSIVLKFDRNLNVIGQQKFATASIEVLGDGSFYAFDGVENSWKTNVKVYDSAFIVKKELGDQDWSMWGARCFGDTIVTYEALRDQVTDDYVTRISFYDTAFTRLSSFTPIDLSKSAWVNPRFDKQTSSGGFLAAPGGIFASILFPVDIGASNAVSLVVFTDGKGAFLGRISVPVLQGLSFDSRGHLYYVTSKYTNPDVHSPMETLYIYTMKPLLRIKNN